MTAPADPASARSPEPGRRSWFGYHRTLRDEPRKTRPTAPPTACEHAPVLERLVTALSRRDASAVERELTDDVELVARGDAAFYGPREPIAGRARIAAALVALTRRGERVERLELTEEAGRPALVVERRPRPGFAARVALIVRLDSTGRIVGFVAHLS